MSKQQSKTRGPGLPAEATLFYQAQNGTRQALNHLMARHEGLVHAIIRRHGLGPLSYAETLQAGRIGLWHAILKFDPTRGYAFSTYAWISIMRYIGRTVKIDGRQMGPWILCARRLPHPTADPVSLMETKAIQDTLHALVQRLAPRLQQTIVAHYGLAEHPPTNFAQIGRTLGLSEERARQLHQEALIWLRQPAHSQNLRSLLGRHTLTDYQALEPLGRRWWRTERHRHAH